MKANTSSKSFRFSSEKCNWSYIKKFFLKLRLKEALAKRKTSYMHINLINLRLLSKQMNWSQVFSIGSYLCLLKWQRREFITSVYRRWMNPYVLWFFSVVVIRSQCPSNRFPSEGNQDFLILFLISLIRIVLLAHLSLIRPSSPCMSPEIRWSSSSSCASCSGGKRCKMD